MSSSPGRFRSPAFTRPARARPFNSTELTRHTSDASARRTLRPARLTSNGSRSVADDDRSTRSIELAFRSDLGAIFFATSSLDWTTISSGPGGVLDAFRRGGRVRLSREGGSCPRLFFHRKKTCSAGYLRAAMFLALIERSWGLFLRFTSSFLERRALSRKYTPIL